MAKNYTVLIPYVPAPYRTQWHPTTASGPFSRLTRGSFETVGEAIEWARKNLDGTPYEIKEFEVA